MQFIENHPGYAAARTIEEVKRKDLSIGQTMITAMSETKGRVLERPQGLGKVFQNEEFICHVLYELEVWQEYTISETQETLGVFIVSGHLDIISEFKELANGKTMLLMLEDGRKWQFVAPYGDFTIGLYTVEGSGEDGILDA